MLRFLNRFLAPRARARRAPRAPLRAQLQVEPLEQRDVPTVVFTPQFGRESLPSGYPSVYTGVSHPMVNLVFSGPYWTTGQGFLDRLQVANSVQSILNGPYLSGLAQYGYGGSSSFSAGWQDSSTVNLGAGNQPNNSDIQFFLQQSIEGHGLSPGFEQVFMGTPIYIVVSDPTSAAQFNGGKNAPGVYWDYNGGNFATPDIIHMIWVGTSTNQFAGVSPDTRVWMDMFTETVSHELAETISDPAGLGGVSPGTSLPSSMVNGTQIGDNEPAQAGQVHYAYRVGGYRVQPYWSAKDNAFIVPDGNAQNFYLQPIWNNTTFTGTYNLRVQGDQLGNNYPDTIRLDQSVFTGGVQVTMNRQTVTFDRFVGTSTNPVINTVNVDTGGGYNYVKVAAVPAGVTANITSTGQSIDGVFVGSDGESLAGIQGTVNVSNSSGQTYLTVDAAADGPRNVTVTNSSVSYAGLTTINYQGASFGGLTGVTNLNVVDGHGANCVDVESVPPQTNVSLYGDTLDTVYGPAAGLITDYRIFT